MRASGRSRGVGQCVYARDDRGISPREVLSRAPCYGHLCCMADGIPITRREVSPERADGIRDRVRQAERLGDAPDASRLAVPDDAAGLFALLLCETASLENVPTQRMLDGMGFARMGEIESVRPDGSRRRSLVWEMTRADWRTGQAGG